MGALDELRPYYVETLKEMSDVFDSHEFIAKLRATQPAAHERALRYYSHLGREAYKMLYSQISRSLYKFADRNGSRISANIWGDLNENAQWRKRKP